MKWAKSIQLCRLKTLLFHILISLFVFGLILIVVRSVRYIDPGIVLPDYEEFEPASAFFFVGDYKTDFTYYHVQRMQDFVLVEDLLNGNEDPLEYVIRLFGEELNTKGWKKSPNRDFGKHDCNFLLPETTILLEDGIETYAFRRERYEPAYAYHTNDLICLTAWTTENETAVYYVVVTARPTLINMLLDFIST